MKKSQLRVTVDKFTLEVIGCARGGVTFYPETGDILSFSNLDENELEYLNAIDAKSVVQYGLSRKLKQI